jgi:hypothetical protein
MIEFPGIARRSKGAEGQIDFIALARCMVIAVIRTGRRVTLDDAGQDGVDA